MGEKRKAVGKAIARRKAGTGKRAPGSGKETGGRRRVPGTGGRGAVSAGGKSKPRRKVVFSAGERAPGGGNRGRKEPADAGKPANAGGEREEGKNKPANAGKPADAGGDRGAGRGKKQTGERPREAGQNKPANAGPDPVVSAWLGKAAMCAVLGVSQPYFDRDIRPRIPASYIRKVAGGRVEIYGPQAIEARYAPRLAEALRSAGFGGRGAGTGAETNGRTPAGSGERGAGSIGGPPGDEMLFEGADSPMLERYRKLRGDLAELDVEMRRGNLLPRDAVRVLIGRIAVRLRQAGEALQRMVGDAAVGIFQEALDDAVAAAVDVLGVEDAECGVRDPECGVRDPSTGERGREERANARGEEPGDGQGA